ncbi:MAG: alpha-ribazole phosphatase [Pseudomonadota bacterium]
MAPRSIYLVRHTEVGVPDGTCYGQTDVPLHTNAPQHIEQVRAKLTPVTDRHIVSSPLTRCRRLSEALGGPDDIDARLQELHFGAWEMQSWSGIERGELNRWRDDIVDAPPPGGEAFGALAERATACIESLLAEATDASSLVIVTHGGVIRALLAWALEVPLEKALAMHVDYGGVTRVDAYPEHRRIHYVNR